MWFEGWVAIVSTWSLPDRNTDLPKSLLYGWEMYDHGEETNQSVEMSVSVRYVSLSIERIIVL